MQNALRVLFNVAIQRSDSHTFKRYIINKRLMRDASAVY